MTTDPNTSPQHPPIHEIQLGGKNGLEVIARNREVAQIAAHAAALRPRVERFDGLMERVKQHKVSLRAALLGERRHGSDLRRAWRTWCVHVQRDVPAFVVRDISIFETQSLDAMLSNVDDVRTVIEAHRADLPYAEHALAELTTLHAAAATTQRALRDGRAALQNTQRELHVAAGAVHEELVRLRYTLRLMLGVSHQDSKLLRARRPRSAAQPEVDVGVEAMATTPVPDPGPERGAVSGRGAVLSAVADEAPPRRRYLRAVPRLFGSPSATARGS